MFTKTITLDATKTCFRFTHGPKEASFFPVVYLDTDHRVVSVGEAPPSGTSTIVARIFDEDFENAFAVLEAMLRYGAQLVCPGFSLIRPSYEISIGPDIRNDLKGFAAPLFGDAAFHAGAAKVRFISKESPNKPLAYSTVDRSARLCSADGVRRKH